MMSATGAIPTSCDEGWIVALGTALVRWSRRRSARADISEHQYERRAELEERIYIDRELQAHRQEMERSIALQRLYPGF
jgi:hypothetical protein